MDRVRTGSAILALLGAIVAWAVPVRADIVIINNGSSPPDPANVVDTDLLDVLFVQNVGCDFTVAPPPCAAPGAPTTVAFVAGGAAESVLVAQTSVLRLGAGSTSLGVGYEGSPTIEIDGAWIPVAITPLSFPAFDGAPQINLVSGDVGMIELQGGVQLTQTGGHADSLLLGYGLPGTPVAALSGGSVDAVRFEGAGDLHASGTALGEMVSYGGGFASISGGSLATLDMQTDVFDAGEVEFVGSRFAVDGVAASGEISAASGTLTGILASGDSLSVAFTRDPEATIRLVSSPPAVPSLGSLGLSLLAAALAAVGVGRQLRR